MTFGNPQSATAGLLYLVSVQRPDFSDASEAVRRSMRSNKGRDTSPELALRRRVHRLGLRYRVNERPLPSLRRTGDLVFRRSKLVVFVDGCFWHSCPDHGSLPAARQEWWAAKLERTVQRDRETNEALRAAGWTVLRIWEHEDMDEAAQRVVTTLVRIRLQHDSAKSNAPDPA
ncbi:MAG: DNA mismatch endonuclease Vsr [Acidimicrobiia bacterium]|nr:DNA mismatch endonuclease Vsr [Acidimicrobiia bacterium]